MLALNRPRKKLLAQVGARRKIYGRVALKLAIYGQQNPHYTGASLAHPYNRANSLQCRWIEQIAIENERFLSLILTNSRAGEALLLCLALKWASRSYNVVEWISLSMFRGRRHAHLSPPPTPC